MTDFTTVSGSQKHRRRRIISALVVMMLLVSALLSFTGCDPLGEIDHFMNSLFPSDTDAVTETPTTAPIPVTPDGTLTVHFLDVGQGDCTLIKTPDGCVLIDAGDIDTAITDGIIRYLRALGVTTIDYFVLTHPHADHIGGAPAILTEFAVTRVIMPEATTNTRIFNQTLDAIETSGADVIQAEPGEQYMLGALSMLILAPYGSIGSNLNNASVVIRFDYGEASLLLTGDAEDDSEQKMLAVYSSPMLNCDVMKAGHHGSSTANTVAFLQAVTPSLFVISCGTDNSYGHPHAETITRLTHAGIPYYRTDLDGTIVLTSDGGDFRVLSPETAARGAK